MKWTLAVIAGLLAASSARADIAPRTPGVAWGYPVYLIETGANFPDNVFILDQTRWRGSIPEREVHFVTFDRDNPLVITPRYRESHELLIVPRTATSSYPSALDLVAAVHRGDIPGVLRQTFDFRIEVPAWRAGRIVVIYWIRRIVLDEDESAVVVIVRQNWHYPLREWYIALGFLVAGIVTTGLWLRRRKRRAGNRATQVSSNPSSG